MTACVIAADDDTRIIWREPKTLDSAQVLPPPDFAAIICGVGGDAMDVVCSSNAVPPISCNRQPIAAEV